MPIPEIYEKEARALMSEAAARQFGGEKPKFFPIDSPHQHPSSRQFETVVRALMRSSGRTDDIAARGDRLLALFASVLPGLLQPYRNKSATADDDTVRRAAAQLLEATDHYGRNATFEDMVAVEQLRRDDGMRRKAVRLAWDWLRILKRFQIGRGSDDHGWVLIGALRRQWDGIVANDYTDAARWFRHYLHRARQTELRAQSEVTDDGWNLTCRYAERNLAVAMMQMAYPQGTADLLRYGREKEMEKSVEMTFQVDDPDDDDDDDAAATTATLEMTTPQPPRKRQILQGLLPHHYRDPIGAVVFAATLQTARQIYAMGLRRIRIPDPTVRGLVMAWLVGLDLPGGLPQMDGEVITTAYRQYGNYYGAVPADYRLVGRVLTVRSSPVMAGMVEKRFTIPADLTAAVRQHLSYGTVSDENRGKIAQQLSRMDDSIRLRELNG